MMNKEDRESRPVILRLSGEQGGVLGRPRRCCLIVSGSEMIDPAAADPRHCMHTVAYSRLRDPTSSTAA